MESIVSSVVGSEGVEALGSAGRIESSIRLRRSAAILVMSGTGDTGGGELRRAFLG